MQFYCAVDEIGLTILDNFVMCASVHARSACTTGQRQRAKGQRSARTGMWCIGIIDDDFEVVIKRDGG